MLGRMRAISTCRLAPQSSLFNVLCFGVEVGRIKVRPKRAKPCISTSPDPGIRLLLPALACSTSTSALFFQKQVKALAGPSKAGQPAHLARLHKLMREIYILRRLRRDWAVWDVVGRGRRCSIVTWYLTLRSHQGGNPIIRLGGHSHTPRPAEPSDSPTIRRDLLYESGRSNNLARVLALLSCCAKSWSQAVPPSVLLVIISFSSPFLSIIFTLWGE